MWGKEIPLRIKNKQLSHPFLSSPWPRAWSAAVRPRKKMKWCRHDLKLQDSLVTVRKDPFQETQAQAWMVDSRALAWACGGGDTIDHRLGGWKRKERWSIYLHQLQDSFSYFLLMCILLSWVSLTFEDNKIHLRELSRLFPHRTSSQGIR